MKHIMEYDEQCKSCQGTGLYVGFAERDGAAIVCHTCKGSGCHHVKTEYEDFEGLKHKEGAKQVYAANPGITIGADSSFGLKDFGGISYSDWSNKMPFPKGSEMRRFCCPAWWYQSADYQRKPSWDWCSFCGSFSGCKHFATKEKCWERFDKEGL